MFNSINLGITFLAFFFLISIFLNKINIFNFFYGIILNLIIFTEILIIVSQSNIIWFLIFLFFFFSFDIVIFFTYIYTKFTNSLVKNL